MKRKVTINPLEKGTPKKARTPRAQRANRIQKSPNEARIEAKRLAAERNRKRYMKVGSIPPKFKDQTIYLVGGGPSLKGFDFNKLKGKKVIAINKAFVHIPFADVMYWTDNRFYNWFKAKIHEFKGMKVTNKPKPVADDIINLRDSGRTGLDLDKSSLRHGNNSGYAAINLAVHLGAKKIVLLGYDMGLQGNKSHWHDGYATPANRKVYQNSMMPHFNTLVEPLRNLGIEIWNANPTSNLKCFPKCSLEDGLKK